MNAAELLSTVIVALDRPWLRALVVIVVGLIGLRLLTALMRRRLAGAGRPHLVLVSVKTVTYGGAVAILALAARVAGLDLTALMATAGILTVAIGFAAQTSLSNLIAGLFLLVDRPFQVGDFIEVDGRSGTVESITLLSTYVRTLQNIRVRWPNEVMLKATILNFSAYPARRVDLPVQVGYGADLAAARRVLTAAAAAVPEVLLDPAPEAVVLALLDNGVSIELRAWTPQASFLRARTALVIALLDRLRAAGIEIPFPQLTVWQAAHAQPSADQQASTDTRDQAPPDDT